jgi:hypothetical protein
MRDSELFVDLRFGVGQRAVVFQSGETLGPLAVRRGKLKSESENSQSCLASLGLPLPPRPEGRAKRGVSKDASGSQPVVLTGAFFEVPRVRGASE